MVAPPISTHLVQTIFQYILPPNLPIPHHLLSTPSLERHHYLSISPTDVPAYLCWPSPDADEIVQLMEETSSQDAFMTKPEHDVRYTASDEDTLLAHVHPSPESRLRVIFMWNSNTSRWGYHDCRLMPFPPEAHSQPGPAMMAHLKASSRSLSRSSSPDSDYWGGYASSDTSPTAPVPPTISVEDEGKVEAAYWASYGAVHGSGDSTVPSPRLRKQSIPASTETHARLELDPFLANLHIRLHNQEEFLSPRYASPERPHSPQPVGSVSGYDTSNNAHNQYGFLDAPEVEVEAQNYGEQFDTAVAEGPTVDCEPGLREAIKGLYHVWKRGSETRNEGEFVNIVKDVLYS